MRRYTGSILAAERKCGIRLHYHGIVLYGAVLYVWYMLSNTVQYVSRGRITIGMKYRPVYGKIAVVLLVVNTIWKNGNLLLFHKGL